MQKDVQLIQSDKIEQLYITISIIKPIRCTVYNVLLIYAVSLD